MTVVNSWNEWDPLREIIVGSVRGAADIGYEPALSPYFPPGDAGRGFRGAGHPCRFAGRGGTPARSFRRAAGPPGHHGPAARPDRPHGRGEDAGLGHRGRARQRLPARRAAGDRRRDHRSADGAARPVVRVPRLSRPDHGLLSRRRAMDRGAEAAHARRPLCRARGLSVRCRRRTAAHRSRAGLRRGVLRALRPRHLLAAGSRQQRFRRRLAAAPSRSRLPRAPHRLPRGVTDPHRHHARAGAAGHRAGEPVAARAPMGS